jgi:hypothetical protein
MYGWSTEYKRIQNKNLPGIWISVLCEFCVLSDRGLCDGPILRLEESYRLWCVIVCDLETSTMRRPWPALGRCAREGKKRSTMSVRSDSSRVWGKVTVILWSRSVWWLFYRLQCVSFAIRVTAHLICVIPCIFSYDCNHSTNKCTIILYYYIYIYIYLAYMFRPL